MDHTPRLVIEALLAAITTLPPRCIAEAEAALVMARQRAEVIIEIDAVGLESACPFSGKQP